MMNRDEAVAALDLCTELGYSCSLTSNVRPKMAPPHTCYVELRPWPEVSMEELIGDFAETLYEVVLSTALEKMLYLEVRGDTGARRS